MRCITRPFKRDLDEVVAESAAFVAVLEPRVGGYLGAFPMETVRAQTSTRALVKTIKPAHENVWVIDAARVSAHGRKGGSHISEINCLFFWRKVNDFLRSLSGTRRSPFVPKEISRVFDCMVWPFFAITLRLIVLTKDVLIWITRLHRSECVNVGFD